MLNPVILSAAEKRTIYSYIEVFNKLYEIFGIKIFAIGGTLLGAIRNSDIINWDDDVDYAIRVRDLNLLAQPKVLQYLNDRGFVIYKKKGIKYKHIWHLIKANGYHNQQSLQTINHADYNRMVSGRGSKVIPKHGICADIFGYQLDGATYSLMKQDLLIQPICRRIMEADLIRYPYGLSYIYSVCDPIDYLTTVYGKQWKTPRIIKPHRPTRLIDTTTCVYVIGVFDLLHSGHYNLLHRAKQLGTRLVVGVCSDRLVAKTKSERCVLDQYCRLNMLEKLDIVDKVFIYDDLDQSLNILKENTDVFVIPPDYGQYPGHNNSIDMCRRIGVNVQVINRTDGISSTHLRGLITHK